MNVSLRTARRSPLLQVAKSALATIAAWLIAGWLVLRATPGTANQVAISALLVLALGTATPGYAVDRILETAIGAAIGLTVNVALVPPLALESARARVTTLTEEAAAALDRLGAALTTRQDPQGLHELLTRARAVRDTVASAQTPLADARDSLALNPRGRRLAADVTALEDDVQRLSAIVTQVIGMTRAFVDDYDDTISSDPEAIAIAEQLRRAAHDVRLGLPATGGAPLEEPPALTRPLEVLTVPRSHWVLIGSLLIDLRRIHSALAASDES